MALKRKRSDSELSSATTLSFSSPRLDFNFEAAMPVSPVPIAFSRVQSSLLNSRTLKRSRNNRPADEEVHQRTLGLLYAAQNQHVHPPATPSPAPRPQTALPAAHVSVPVRLNQRSLHSFWTLPSGLSPAASASSVEAVDVFAPTSCEDCGAAFGTAAGGDDSMDLDDYSPDGDHTCGTCEKQVCFHCSVTNLGEQRRCLQCAGRYGWA